MKVFIPKENTKIDDIRTRNAFAFLPKRVGSYIVWLEKYEITETYKTVRYPVTGSKSFGYDERNEWVIINKRVLHD